ncbi:MAG: ABC transporter substrate-binding protein [Ignavibacteria bacterium]|nr:MAG: ABC transporter substrate-binding protein [Ignavibacteria bacterium]
MEIAQTLLQLIIVLAILASGCGTKNDRSPGKVTITFWHSFVSATVPAFDELLKEFEKQHPTIEVRAQYVPTGDALLQKLITAVQSRSAPDISWIHSNYLQNLVEADAIYPMDEFTKGPNGLSAEELNDLYPALLQGSAWRGTVYSMPMEATNLGLMFNKQMFRDAGLDPERGPGTWDELYAYAKKLTVDKDHDGKIDQYGFFIPIFPASGPLGDWMVWQWYPFLWQAGGYEIDSGQTHLLLNGDAGVKALSFWKKIYDDLNLRSVTADYDAAFAGKKLAMAMDGPWNLPRYEKLKELDWAAAPLPAGPAKRATVVGGEYLVIFKQSEHPSEAWTLIKWLLDPEVQALWSEKSGYLPVRHSVLQVKEYQEFLKKKPGLRAFVEQMEVGQATRPIDYHGLEISRNLAVAIEKATVGGLDPKNVLDEAAAASDQLLRQTAKR